MVSVVGMEKEQISLKGEAECELSFRHLRSQNIQEEMKSATLGQLSRKSYSRYV